MTAPKSRLKRWAPIWHLALRGNRLLRDERIAHRQTRQERATYKALAEHGAAEIADLKARCRMLDETLDFLAVGRTQAMERGE